jgi:hypothetical protein
MGDFLRLVRQIVASKAAIKQALSTGRTRIAYSRRAYALSDMMTYFQGVNP